jgi:hypothetical protein
VLLEVFGGPGQGRGEGQVAAVVAGTPDGAGQHAGGDQAALASHQHLRGGAEEAVDVEGPAHRVAGREALQRPPDVDRLVEGRDQVAGQHDLLQRSRADPVDRVGHDPHPLLAVEGAVGEAQADRRTGLFGHGDGGVLIERAARDGGEPGPGTAATDDELGDRQQRVAGVVGEGEAAEADQPGARLVDLVAHHGARRSSPSTTCRRRRTGSDRR